MATAPKAPPTFGDLLSLQHSELGQILGGELVVTPRPPLKHRMVAALLGGELFEAFDRGVEGPEGWWILHEPELKVNGDILVADIAGWRRKKMEQLPREFPVAVAPDWVCEVLWPGSAGLDRVQKLPLYAKAGVELVWLVDPTERSVEVYRLEEGRYRLFGGHLGDEPTRLVPFQTMELKLGRFWNPSAQ